MGDFEVFPIEEEDGGPTKTFCFAVVMGEFERSEALFKEHNLHGGGPTWEGIMCALVDLKMPELAPVLDIGAEADNAYIYSEDRPALERVAALMRSAVADHKLLKAAIKHAGDDLE